MKRTLARRVFALVAIAYFATWVWGGPPASRLVEKHVRALGVPEVPQTLALEAVAAPQHDVFVGSIHPRVMTRTLPIGPGLLLVRADCVTAGGGRWTRTELVLWFVVGTRRLFGTTT